MESIKTNPCSPSPQRLTVRRLGIGTRPQHCNQHQADGSQTGDHFCPLQFWSDCWSRDGIDQ